MFAAWYPTLMEQIERNGQAAIRHDHLAAATGRVLEIGAGSGLSVPHYPADLEELVLLEPNSAFRTRLRELLDGTQVPATLVDGDVHDLPYPDATFDTVTASLVFCSVRDPAARWPRCIGYCGRVARFLFHEHVRGGPVRGVVQDLFTPLHRRLADGCHADRDFEALLASSPLQVESVEHLRMPTWIPTLVPLVVGAARRAAIDPAPQPAATVATEAGIKIVNRPRSVTSIPPP